jgi:hypothetical protein
VSGKVFIEINGVKWGLQIKPDHAVKLVDALNRYWIATRRGTANGKELVACDEAFEQLVESVHADAKQNALGIVK